MASIRESIAGMAQIGNVKFWATRATPQPTPRRVMQYTGVGVVGAVTEDLGRNARTEILNATVNEDVYLDLDQVKNAAKVVTCVHPLFGVFEGRLIDVTFDAGPDDMVDIVCTLVEHGDPSAIFIVTVNSTAAKKQSADSVFDDMDLDGLDDFPTATGLPAAGQGLTGSYGNFSALMEAGPDDTLWTEVAAGFNDLAESGNTLIEAIDGYADATQELVDMVDSTYELINIGREYVDAMERQVSDVWQSVKITHPLSVAEIALELVGNATEDTIDTILDRNPALIDICAVPIGTELSIPVNL
jgi:hypothetical protein